MSGHLQNNTIIVGPRHEVVVVKVTRHDEEEWRGMTNNALFISLIILIPVA